MFRRKKEIPPPLTIPAVETPEADISIPYQLSEWPRMFLTFLSTSSKLGDREKKLIAMWLSDYEIDLAGYIGDVYGLEGIVRANEITTELHHRFVDGVNAAASALEGDLFSRLEEDMNRDGEE